MAQVYIYIYCIKTLQVYVYIYFIKTLNTEMIMEKKCIILMVPKEYHKRLKKEAAEQEVSIKILILRGLALLLDHTEKTEITEKQK